MPLGTLDSLVKQILLGAFVVVFSQLMPGSLRVPGQHGRTFFRKECGIFFVGY